MNTEPENETIEWTAKPSHSTNLPKYLFITLCAFIWLIAPYRIITGINRMGFDGAILTTGYTLIILSFNLIPALKIFSTRYEITTQRILIYSGILNRTRDEIELYRIKDYQVFTPVYLRILGCSNITIITSDRITPIVTLYGVREAYNVTNLIRNLVERMRDKKGVREID